MDLSAITDIIIKTINNIFGNLFSSIDNNIYNILDNIIFVNTDIIHDSHLELISGSSAQSGFLLIGNALLLGFLIYYSLKLLLANFGITQVESPYSFIFKLILLGLLMNSSLFFCEQIISLVSIFSSSIRSLGEELFNTSICFSNLIEKINNIITINSESIDIFSIDGILKSFISFGFLKLIFSYSIRYIMIKVFILISPFSILSFSVSPTFFKSWFKCFISLLFIQILVAIILLLLFSIDFTLDNLFYKFIFIGAIFALDKANSYVREFMGGITTEVSQGFGHIRNNLSS